LEPARGNPNCKQSLINLDQPRTGVPIRKRGIARRISKNLAFAIDKKKVVDDSDGPLCRVTND